jgi:hypothetical protein
MAEPPRRFPPPWRADKMPGGYVVRDAYSRETEVEARQAKTGELRGPSHRLAKFLFGILLAIMSLTMGRGLSPLQKDILAVLEEFPAREDFPEEGTISLSSWAHPRQILQRLKRPPTASNRTAVSKALARLVERGMVAAARSDLYSAGKSFFYVRIAGATRAGAP